MQRATNNAVDTAYAHLRGLIMVGTLRPGDRILEGDVAMSVGISRTPVREALRRLYAEGLVELIANKGARVASFDVPDHIEVYQLRLLLEPFAAAEAAAKATDRQISAMQAASTEMKHEVSEQYEGWSRRLTALNREFHGLILEAAGNMRLLTLAQNLMDPGLVHLTFAHYTAEELERSMQHHDEIVAALKAGSGTWANAVMASHLAAAFEVTRRGATVHLVDGQRPEASLPSTRLSPPSPIPTSAP